MHEKPETIECFHRWRADGICSSRDRGSPVRMSGLPPGA